ncbi:hypothetical protein [Haloarcula argentinensis]|uniref:Uncharacterized protein n=1 Tax=Haloarcula argentinensis TaxID=43776 RepID=A0ABU2F7L0_HALAR|nr:hypothetical protein [Haloarcula argentinensis]MDS0256031.1 hypothetical protein [Haloarcula argentinensis]
MGLFRFLNQWREKQDGTLEGPALNTDEITNVADRILDSVAEIESLPEDVSDGETVAIGRPDTPYQLTRSDLNIDGVSGLTLLFQSRFATNGDPILQAADGANVGGFVFGQNTAVNDLTVRNYGFDGNAANQTSGTELEAVEIQSASDVDLINAYASNLYPQNEHNSGGSAFVFSECDDVSVRRVKCDNPGDRTLELFSVVDFDVKGVFGTEGYDRTVTVANGSKHGSVETVRSTGNADGSVVATQGTSSAYCEDVTIRDVKARGPHARAAKAEQYSQNVRFYDITSEPSSGQGGFGVNFKGGVVRDVLLDDFQFTGIGAPVTVRKDSDRVKISNGEIRDANDAGMVIFGNTTGTEIEVRNVLATGSSGVDFKTDTKDVIFDGVTYDTIETAVRTIVNGKSTQSAAPGSGAAGDYWGGHSATAYQHNVTIVDTSTSPSSYYKADEGGNWVQIG